MGPRHASSGFCWQRQAVLADPDNAPLQAGPPGGGAPSGFIRVQGGTFVDDDCNEFLLFGWNRCVRLCAALHFSKSNKKAHVSSCT